MREFIWRGIARILSRPAIADWIIRRAQRTPYSAITSRDGTETYMDRWWLFNPYSKDEKGNAGPARWSFLPSIRVHHIMRPDDDGAMHDHPWNARTIVLRGSYVEERPFNEGEIWAPKRSQSLGERWVFGEFLPRELYARYTGYTGPVMFGAYHRISHVPRDGVYTLWFTWKYRGTWGFKVNGQKVPWREYLANRGQL